MLKTNPIIEIKKTRSSNNRTYTIKDLCKSLQTKYNLDFDALDYDQLKEHAFNKASYLLDIACDIKELLQDTDKKRHDYIRVLLEHFTKQAHLERFQRNEREKYKEEKDKKEKYVKESM